MYHRLFSTFIKIHNQYLNSRFIISVEKRNDILGERILINYIEHVGNMYNYSPKTVRINKNSSEYQDVVNDLKKLGIKFNL